MDKSNVVEFAGRDKIVDPLTDLVENGSGAAALPGGRRGANCRRCWPGIQRDVYAMAGQEWFVMAICQRARFRREWAR